MIDKEQLALNLKAFYESSPRNNGLPFTYEESMEKYKCILKGDPEGMHDSVENFRLSSSDEWVLRFSSSPLVSAKYLFIMWTTLASRVAVEAGLTLDESMSVLCLFTRMMDDALTLERLTELFEAIFLEYIMMVRSKRVATSTATCLHAPLQYINRHIHERITVQEVAEASMYSKRQLDRIFKKEMNMTVSGYITMQKMQRAAQYLCLTEQSIADISIMLGFSSQSHFTSLFHAAYGITPRKYRESATASSEPKREKLQIMKAPDMY